MTQGLRPTRSKSTWYVSYEPKERPPPGKYRPLRKADTFRTEQEAKAFAKARLADSRNINAGTLNPHLPKRTINSIQLRDWLEAGKVTKIHGGIVKTRDIYEKVKAAIQQAASRKEYDLPMAVAEANGFSKRETSKNNLAFECTYFGFDGAIKLEYRSYDPSGPFQNLPDRNRYFLTLYGEADRYSLDYDD